ncbi:MAG: integrin alpha [Fuerstiella sp.]|nr:integrin alpha [Fuerstiella sp.]
MQLSIWLTDLFVYAAERERGSLERHRHRPLRRRGGRQWTTESLEQRALLASDFGDAPDIGTGTAQGDYQTLGSDNGPEHALDLTQLTLFLGNSVDADGGTLQNGMATANDMFTTGGSDDEDGVLNPLDLQGTEGAAPNVTLLATNNTGSAATLSGWIDYDADGVFDNATERAQMVVPADTTNIRFTLTFPAIPDGFTGATYARFRLSADTAATDAIGAAQDGEVEDYVFTITGQSSGRVARSLKIAHELNGGPTLANHDYLGFSVASVGDLDGDGVADLAVGRRDDDTGGSNYGAVHLLLLNTNGTVKRSTKIAHELNGGPSLTKFDGFGSSVVGVGDLDGDGATDLAVEANADNGGGAVHILLLNTDGTAKRSVRISSETNGGPTLPNGDLFGRSVAFLGDLDGDGVGDLAVGAIGDPTGGHSYGATHVLFLKPDGTVKSSTKIAHQTNGGPTLGNNFQFGRSVAGLGDLDGDGVSDPAVGVPQDSTGGQRHGVIYVMLLNTDGTVNSSRRIGHETNGGPTLSMFARFRSSVASVGDLDGDGVADLAVGAKETMHVLFMNRDGTAKRSTMIGSDIGGGPTLPDFSEFGSSVANPGDLDGDGVADLVVGAFRDDTGGRSRGAVWVLNLARPSGVTATHTAGTSMVAESGTTDTFGVVLDARPELDVVIDVTSADIGDIGEVTVSTPLLVFTPTNWDTVQNVTLRGVDDNTVDGDQNSLVTLSNADSSSDASYESLPHQSVTVTTTDNDVLPQDPGNVDGNQDFDANDSFLIHLVKLSGTDAQLDQSKGSSSLSPVQIRANVAALGGVGGAQNAAVGSQVLASVLFADPDRDLFIADDEVLLQSPVPATESEFDEDVFRDNFREWIDAS